MHKNIYVSIISFFLLIAIISGVMIHSHFKEANEQEERYNNLAQIVEKNETSPETETPMPTTPPEGGKLVMLPEYAELYEQNNDLIGWICIEDTKINYPVMQSLDEPNFYLKHGFDRGYRRVCSCHQTSPCWSLQVENSARKEIPWLLIQVWPFMKEFMYIITAAKG